MHLARRALALTVAFLLGFIVGAACAVMDEPPDPHRRADQINASLGLV